jgi:hypothetical protein
LQADLKQRKETFMDSISILTTALALGAAAGLKDTAAQAVKDAYARLKAFIEHRYTQVNLKVLEADPHSAARRSVMEEDLRKAGVDRDEEVLRKAQGLLDTIHSLAPTGAPQVFGVNLEHIRGASLEITNILAKGVGGVGGVQVKNSEFVNDLKITGVQAIGVTEVNPDEDMSRTGPTRTTILFLGANPLDTTRLRLDEEYRAIDQALRQAEFRDRFNIQQHSAVRVADLQPLLLRHRPGILHFSGHGSNVGEIILEDANGQMRPVSVEALGALFSLLKDNLRCVVLNACYSQRQAEAIAQHIDCVVGMSTSIGDRAAITFAFAFYQAIGDGKDIKTAFRLGCSQIDLEGIGEQDTPKLWALRCEPSAVMFAGLRDTAPKG